ncbi:MAG: amidase [Bacillota bacterium]
MSSQPTDLCYVPALELARMIREKEVSPVEVTKVYLERIERLNPQVNAFCTVAGDQARQAAHGAEIAVLNGEPLGPLHGVPVAIKDLTPTAGIRTTYGSRIFADHIPDEDAVFVERVKKAGAIVLGKTNTPEFGHTATTDNSLFGPTRNPWNLERTVGGSSGGSAAAVALGLTALAEGSDGGGSVRIPASTCGVYGLKPTYGRIPFDTSPSKFSSDTPFLHHGTITRTVADAALLLSVVSGPDRRDPFSLPFTGEDYVGAIQKDIRGLRIAFSPDLGYFEIDPQVSAAVEDTTKILADLGCIVETVSPGFDNPIKTVQGPFNLMWCVHFASFYAEYLPQWQDQLSRGVLAMIKTGQRVPVEEYKRAEIARSVVWDKIEDIFSRYDLLLTPTLAVPAFPLGIPGPKEVNGKAIDPYSGWMLTYPFNLTGHPAASVPCGFTRDSLPMGAQVIGRRFDESTILAVSAAIEKAKPWINRKPQVN